MDEKKKTPIISKRGRKKQSGKNLGQKILGVDQRVQKLKPGEDPRVNFFPEELPDYEKINREINDEISKHKYPPPKAHPTFRRVWAEYIDNICARENFKTGHLTQLEILCDLHVEYDQHQEFIRKNGRSYKVASRDGIIWRPFPEVLLLGKCQQQMLHYMKILGLLLKKDSSTKSGGEKESWD